MDTARKRILYFIEKQGIRPVDFLSSTGLKKGFIDKSHQDSGATDLNLSKILESFPELSAEWLVTGKGEMLKNKVAISGKKTNVFKLRTDVPVQNQIIPLYNLEASAGLVELFRHQGDSEPIDHISIPHLPKCDGAVFTVGDSMYPLLKSGDIVMYKELKDIKEGIFYGEMYLISLDVDGEEYVSVKWIQKSDKGEDYIKLVSENRHHQPKDVHLKKVRAMAIVKASIRINAMR